MSTELERRRDSKTSENALAVHTIVRIIANETRMQRPAVSSVLYLVLAFGVAMAAAVYGNVTVVQNAALAESCLEQASALCLLRNAAIWPMRFGLFGAVAIALALWTIVRPNPHLAAAALATSGIGLVLYNVSSSALAVSLLVLLPARTGSRPARPQE